MSTEVVYLQRCHTKLLVPLETAAVSGQVLCTPYTHTPCYFMQSHIRKVHACLAVTRHLHFWQNDRDFLSATAVIRGWNGYRNKSQHRQSTLEKKIIQGFEPATFQSRVWYSNSRAIPASSWVDLQHLRCVTRSAGRRSKMTQKRMTQTCIRP